MFIISTSRCSLSSVTGGPSAAAHGVDLLEERERDEPLLSRRRFLALTASLLGAAFLPSSSSSAYFPGAAAAAPEVDPVGTVTFQGSGYSLSLPASYERKGKAGADVLFEDPTRRSTSVGVSVSPVRVKDLEAFGTLDFVVGRLLEVEKAKESTLSVDLVAKGVRSQPGAGAGDGGDKVAYYDIEYLIDTTRGKKRIFNTVRKDNEAGWRKRV